MQINMDDTNRDLVSLISVILLLIIRQSSINIAVLQFFCEKTPKKALSITLPSRFVGIFIYIYALVSNLLADQEELGYFHDHRIGFSNF